MKEDDGRGRRAAPLEAGRAPSPATDVAPNLGQIYYELERARDNLNQRFTNGGDKSAGRSARAIMSALCAFDTIRASAGKTAAQQSEGEATLKSSIRSEALEEALKAAVAECKRWDKNMGSDEGKSISFYIKKAVRALKEGK